jgi:mRNA interferase MazF
LEKAISIRLDKEAQEALRSLTAAGRNQSEAVREAIVELARRGRRGDLAAEAIVIIAPTSTRAHPASFRPEVEIDGQRTRVLVEQLGAIDPSRLGKSQGLLAFRELREVDRALAVVFGLGS